MVAEMQAESVVAAPGGAPQQTGRGHAGTQPKAVAKRPWRINVISEFK
jgi:hypothetical protein